MRTSQPAESEWCSTDTLGEGLANELQLRSDCFSRLGLHSLLILAGCEAKLPGHPFERLSRFERFVDQAQKTNRRRGIIGLEGT